MWKKKKCIWMCVGRQDDDEDATTLDYRHCKLDSVPSDVFAHERTLEELFLDSNQIRDLPRELFCCQSLSYLHISDNELVSLPSMISSLINLEKLDISKNAIVDLPEELSGCKLLQSLEASVNPFRRVPEGLTRLIGLTELCLNDCFLDALPTNIGRLNRLKVLELRENHLQTLPSSFSSLMLLERLDLGTNDFVHLPEVIVSLVRLQELWIDNNKLTCLPQALGSLQHLTFLDASKNCIESVAAEIERCISLTDLHLSNNRLQRVPESLGRLSSLSTLKLNENCLVELPFSIGGLVSLTELDISCNNLEDLPVGMGFLRHLRTLYADDNFLKSVPVEIGSCSRLTILSLRTNNLVCVPDEFGRIAHLTVLNLSDNKLQSLPFGLTKLKELTALWLADNQNNPLLKLQTEVDRETGQRTLTCYLLPQQTVVIPSDEEALNEPNDGGQVSSRWEEENHKQQKKRRIRFEQDILEEQGHLQRTPTPYPKELKRRLQRRREQAIAGQLNGRQSTDGVVFGRRTQRQLAESSHHRSAASRLPMTVERHILFQAEKEQLLRDRARMNSSGNTNTKSVDQSSFALNSGGQQNSSAQISSQQRNASSRTNMGVASQLDARQSADTNKVCIETSVDEPAGRREATGASSVSSQATSRCRHLNGSVEKENKPKVTRETDIDSVVDFHNINNTCGTGESGGNHVASVCDVINNNNSSAASRHNGGIEVMSYSDFIKSLSSRGIPPPRRIAVNRDVTQGARYVVSNVPQQRAQVRSLRRHGYESEDGRVAIQQHRPTSHGHESDRSYHSNGRRRAPRGYDSDVGCHGDRVGGRYNHSSIDIQSNQCRNIRGPIREEETALASDSYANSNEWAQKAGRHRDNFTLEPRISNTKGDGARKPSRRRNYEPIEL